ncbi:MAG TPA: hypothetical protein VFA34_04160 [Actinomycetota bacterium]|jgi:hypothetical protein|nr:hypothetical protein [Actinomycetota bacterium]
MRTSNDTSAHAVLAPVDAATLSGLEVDDGFEAYADGNPTRIGSMLIEAAESSTSRVAIALGPARHIVGFAIARSPDRSSRLYTAVSAVELTAFEVARLERRKGVFGAVFRALLRRDLEESIVFSVADPELRLRGETARSFRERLETVLGSAGFAPMPTDEPELHAHRDSTLFVRVGRGVPLPDVEDFYARLRAPLDVSVAISLRAPVMRNLIRADLERNGFRVRSVSAGGRDEGADILVTDDGGTGGRLTVRLNGEVEPLWRGDVLWYPVALLETLAPDLRRELIKRRDRHA